MIDIRITPSILGGIPAQFFFFPFTVCWGMFLVFLMPTMLRRERGGLCVEKREGRAVCVEEKEGWAVC